MDGIALSVLQFLARVTTERNDMRPISRSGTKTFANGIVADVTELLAAVRIVAQTGVPEVSLKQNAEMRRQIALEIANDQW